jgi:hypothetical protein
MANLARPLIERLLEKLAPMPNGCLEFVGCRNSDGYGNIALGKPSKRIVYAHRVAYELFCGPIPNGLQVAHHCDNPPCCLPEHLFLATPQENTHDSWRKGRGNHNTYHGTAHPGAILNEKQVAEIKYLLLKGQLSFGAIAALYGVSWGAVSHIKRGNTWAWVEPVETNQSPFGIVGFQRRI